MTTAVPTPLSGSPIPERKLNILLIDDDELDVMNVQRAFRKNNIQNPLFVAHDGVEGLQRLRDGSVPDDRRLVLLDLNMPRMSGIEFLREVRADPILKNTTVVVLTTSAEDRDRVEAYDLNVAGYIIKPVTLLAFIEIMATLNKYWTVNELP
jgi:CheY-like chemotaxis protein